MLNDNYRPRNHDEQIFRDMLKPLVQRELESKGYVKLSTDYRPEGLLEYVLGWMKICDYGVLPSKAWTRLRVDGDTVILSDRMTTRLV